MGIQFDRQKCRQIRSMVQDGMNTIAEKISDLFGENIKIEVDSGRFSTQNVGFKIEVARCNKDGVAQTPEVANFSWTCIAFGLEPTDLHREFMFRNEKYKITGIKPRRYRYPISASRVRDGRGFKFPPDVVKKGLI